MLFKSKTKSIIFSLILIIIPHYSYGYQLAKPDAQKNHSKNVKLLQQISKGISEIANKASKAVVFVSISKTIKGYYGLEFNPFDFFFGPHEGRRHRRMPLPEKKQKGLGSGFIIDIDKGYIVTNNHVIEEADEISVKLANGKTYDGKVLGRDKNTDVAVIQIISKDFDRRGISELRLGNSEEADVGEFVIALGAPFGLESSISFGILSATHRGNLRITNMGNFMQTDAAINPGNSGGPLLDTNGDVIGMNTAIFSRSGASAGIGFAVPSAMVRTVVAQLVAKGFVARGYLGVGLAQELDDDIAAGLGLPQNTKGALISSVQPGAPADDAGLEAGDVVVAVNGKEVKNNNQLTNRIGLISPGTKVELTVFRNGKKKDVEITLTTYPESESYALRKNGKKDYLAGLTLKQINKRNYDKLNIKYRFESKEGLLIVYVAPDSKAAAAGLQVEDVILKVNRKKVKTISEFNNAYNKNRKLLIQIERKGHILFVALRK